MHGLLLITGRRVRFNIFNRAMSKYFLTILFVSSLYRISFSQAPKSYFKLAGSVNIDSGMALLMPLGKDSYYPAGKGSYQSAIISGQFEFSDSILYPYGFRLGIRRLGEWIYISDYFIVDPGIQEITCNIDSLSEIPRLENKSMKEMRSEYLPYFSAIAKRKDDLSDQYDSLRKVYGGSIPEDLKARNADARDYLGHEENRQLLVFTKRHDASYLALWQLIRELKKGYEPILDSVYLRLSVPLKYSYTGKKILEELKLNRALTAGNYFPKLLFLNRELRTKQVPEINAKTKFTLIDFWFSHCSSCIGQFPELKSIFERYKTGGFNIIGISIDEKDKIGSWNKAIATNHLPWDQYLDLDGRQAKKLSIFEFPTNYLLDGMGKILAKDLAPSQLLPYLKTLSPSSQQ
jgi:hypothetical protein